MDNITLTCGDCRDLIVDVPDNSVDLILCDPVYQDIWQYTWVAEQAVRVLKPGRSVICQAGHIHRFEAECAMHAVAGLVHRPLLEEVFTAGYGQIWMHKMLRTSQIYLWFTKDDGKSNYAQKDQYHYWPHSSFWGSKDKSRFSWGDGERAFVYLMDVFSRPDDLVLDPFAGYGTVGAVAKALRRRYLGYEIDPQRAHEAQERLRTAPSPLFVTDRTQGEMVSLLEEQ